MINYSNIFNKPKIQQSFWSLLVITAMLLFLLLLFFTKHSFNVHFTMTMETNAMN